MLSLRRASLVLALFASGLSGCKKDAPPPPPAEKPAEKAADSQKAAAAPEQPAQARADEACAASITTAIAHAADAGAETVKLGTLTATRTGAKLTVTSKDADGKLVLGVLGPLNEASGENLVTLRKYLDFFGKQKADAIVVTGDVGETSEGIARVLTATAEAKLPTFVIAGNRECRGDYVEGLKSAQQAANGEWIVDMNTVRIVELSEATLVSIPGYHDPKFFGCAESCQFFPSTADEAIAAAKEAKQPVVLVAHAPPRGEGQLSIDYATGGGNVGSEEIGRALEEGNITFGVFSNIKEAGGRATDRAGTTLIAEGAAARELFLNPGPADTVGWPMNDGTKSTGMAAVLTVDDGQASYRSFRASSLSAAEKAEAKKLSE